ncbi:MAG: glucose 1-dehydrogenase [Microscillaceae bacterium]|jgi:NAD(P)-dependent dehydrogenase (short-subunit alcohol dehydrogenase family)|nr:glucose 1-dehydrogenase [Microscillaceae bacterium]
MLTYQFSDKVAFITGASSGIGRETALQFAAAKANVVVSDINEKDGLAVVEEIKKNGGEAIFVQTNVADYEQVKSAIEQTLATYGRLDFGINNAGIGGPFTRISDYQLADYQQVMKINVDGVFYCMQWQLQQMLKQESGGVIINTSSIAGLRGLKNSSVYSASKHAVLGLTKSAALEYASKNIRINAICPVFTRTPLFDQMFALDPSYEERLKNNIPMKRYGQPIDIVKTILWLCSDDASFVTGQAYALDGGMTAG